MTEADALTTIAALFGAWLLWPCLLGALVVAGFPVFMFFDFWLPRWKRRRAKAREDHESNARRAIEEYERHIDRLAREKNGDAR